MQADHDQLPLTFNLQELILYTSAAIGMVITLVWVTKGLMSLVNKLKNTFVYCWISIWAFLFGPRLAMSRKRLASVNLADGQESRTWIDIRPLKKGVIPTGGTINIEAEPK